MKTKFCGFCKQEKSIETFQKTRSGTRVNKCNQCKYQEAKKVANPRYVSIRDREKLKIGRD